MSFSAERFPLYQLAQEYKFPGADKMKEDFDAAVSGGAAEKYGFAIGLYSLTQIKDLSRKISIFTPDVLKKTAEGIYATFAEGADANNADSALMAAFMMATGQGTAENRAEASKLVARAESIGGKTPFSEKLRKQLTTVTLVIPPMKPAAGR